MNEGNSSAHNLLESLGLDPQLLGSLSPDVRDLLLDYAQDFEEPSTLLELVERLREVHGPLLFLLDLLAEALLAAGEAARALDVIDRRQRRSTTSATQAAEAAALFALGRVSQARSVGLELLSSELRSAPPLLRAAAVVASCGDAEQARTAVERWLQAHSGHLPAILCLAQIALGADDHELATEMADRLGSGVPSDLSVSELRRLAALHLQMGLEESHRAAALEIGRRRALQWDRLRAALVAYVSVDVATLQDRESVFRMLNGPQSAPVSAEERQRLKVAAMRNFGFSALREGQAETIGAVLRGESVLAIMPTGAGKSLCYQLPALTLPRASLVISPLIALMKDQVESLPPAARSKATFINSTISEAEYEERMSGIAAGRYKLVYAAPERLRQRPFLRTLRAYGLDLFVIDEAHCVSLWGHDFRPDYLFLEEARRELGAPTTLAMTATAPPRVRDEILDLMAGARERTPDGRSQPARVIALDIFRSNLHLSAIRFHNEEEKRKALLHFVEQTPGSGIVYVNTRLRAQHLAADLRSAGVRAEAYHAGMEDRSAIQERFMAGQTRVVVATVAFGMGIDKADIRFIVHFHPARSLAGYYQEVGRAGRDGRPSQGILFYSSNDWASLRRWARADEFSVPFLLRVHAAIASQLNAGEQTEGAAITGAVDVRRLQQVLNADETTVRVAVSILERADLLGRSFDVAQEVEITLPRTLPASAPSDAGFRELVRTVRLGPGKSGAFRMAALAEALQRNHADLESTLLEWQALRYLSLKLSRRAMSITLVSLPADHAARLERLAAQSQALAQRRVDDVVGYATAEGCRHGYISALFGSPPRTRCDVCDNCTGIRPVLPQTETVDYLLPDDDQIRPLILDCVVSLPRALGRSGLSKVLGGRLNAKFTAAEVRQHGALRALGESEILDYVDELVEEGLLRLTQRAGFSVLTPSPAARLEAELWLAEHPELEMVEAPPGQAVEPTLADPALQPERIQFTDLQKALWVWRKRLADQASQPAYVILPNQVMTQIATLRPTTLEDLGNIPGMGANRMERYGPTILDIVRLTPEAPMDREILTAQESRIESERTFRAERRAGASAPVSPGAEKRIRMKLEEIRQKVAVASRMRQGEVAPNSLLSEIARIAPATLPELDAVPGFRSSGLRSEGPQIVTFITALRKPND